MIKQRPPKLKQGYLLARGAPVQEGDSLEVYAVISGEMSTRDRVVRVEQTHRESITKYFLLADRNVRTADAKLTTTPAPSKARSAVEDPHVLDMNNLKLIEQLQSRKRKLQTQRRAIYRTKTTPQADLHNLSLAEQAIPRKDSAYAQRVLRDPDSSHPVSKFQAGFIGNGLFAKEHHPHHHPASRSEIESTWKGYHGLHDGALGDHHVVTSLTPYLYREYLYSARLEKVRKEERQVLEDEQAHGAADIALSEGGAAEIIRKSMQAERTYLDYLRNTVTEEARMKRCGISFAEETAREGVVQDALRGFMVITTAFVESVEMNSDSVLRGNVMAALHAAERARYWRLFEEEVSGRGKIAEGFSEAVCAYTVTTKRRVFAADEVRLSVLRCSLTAHPQQESIERDYLAQAESLAWVSLRKSCATVFVSFLDRSAADMIVLQHDRRVCIAASEETERSQVQKSINFAIMYLSV